MDLTTIMAGDDQVLLTIHAGQTSDVKDIHMQVVGADKQSKVHVAHLDASKDSEVMKILESQRAVNKAARRKAKAKRKEREASETSVHSRPAKENALESPNPPPPDSEESGSSDDDDMAILYIPGGDAPMVRYEGEQTAEAMMEFLQEVAPEPEPEPWTIDEMPDDAFLEDDEIAGISLGEETEDKEEILVPPSRPLTPIICDYAGVVKAPPVKNALREKMMALEEERKKVREAAALKAEDDRKLKREAELQLAKEHQERLKKEEEAAFQASLMLLAAEEEADDDELGEDSPSDGLDIQDVKMNHLSQLVCTFPGASFEAMMGLAKLMGLFLATDVDGSGNIDGMELAQVQLTKDTQIYKKKRDARKQLIEAGGKENIEAHALSAQETAKAAKIVREEIDNFYEMNLSSRVKLISKGLQYLKDLENAEDAKKALNPQYFVNLKKPDPISHYQRKYQTAVLDWDLDNNGELDFEEFAMMASASETSLDKHLSSLTDNVKNEMMTLVHGTSMVNGHLVKSSDKAASLTTQPSPGLGSTGPSIRTKGIRESMSMYSKGSKGSPMSKDLAKRFGSMKTPK